MRQFYFAFYSLILLLFTSCGDGDVIPIEEVSLDFNSDTFETCGELVLFKLENNPARTLSIFLNGVADSIVTGNGGNFLGPEVFENVTNTSIINGTFDGPNNRFNLRTYEGTITASEVFCNDIAPDINILTDDESMEGSVTITTIVIEEDDDGIPWQDEEVNEFGMVITDNDNNPATDPVDIDGDGLPNYLDNDDDGDNVLTVDEDRNGDGDFTNDDTDSDGIPDYLDDDDDGDGVLTRDEENFSQNQNPIDDITNPNVGPDYLNPDIANTTPATAFRPHTIVRSLTTTVEVFNIVLENLTQTFLDFGTFTGSQSRQETPEFN